MSFYTCTHIVPTTKQGLLVDLLFFFLKSQPGQPSPNGPHVIALDFNAPSRAYPNHGRIVGGNMQLSPQFLNKGIAIASYFFDACRGEGSVLAVQKKKEKGQLKAKKNLREPTTHSKSAIATTQRTAFAHIRVKIPRRPWVYCPFAPQ